MKFDNKYSFWKVSVETPELNQRVSAEETPMKKTIERFHLKMLVQKWDLLSRKRKIFFHTKIMVLELQRVSQESQLFGVMADSFSDASILHFPKCVLMASVP